VIDRDAGQLPKAVTAASTRRILWRDLMHVTDSGNARHQCLRQGEYVNMTLLSGLHAGSKEQQS
jgi:hypothetical protein